MFSLSNMSQENVHQETSTRRDVIKCHASDFRIEFAYFVHDILCRYMFTMFTILVYCICSPALSTKTECVGVIISFAGI